MAQSLQDLTVRSLALYPLPQTSKFAHMRAGSVWLTLALGGN